MQLSDRRIVLTGAASGIGAALLKRLATYPVNILAVDIKPIELPPQASAAVETHTADLTTPQAVDEVFDRAQQTMGGVDIFIANAGFAYYELIQRADWSRLQKLFEINLFSPLYAAAKMAEVNTDRPYMIVMTASAMSYMALPGYAYYSATKAGLHRFAEAYRYEMPSNGHLMLIYPISTRTDFFNQDDTGRRAPTPRPSQSPDYVAEQIIKGILRDRKAVHPSPGFILFWAVAKNIPALRRVYQRHLLRPLLSWRSDQEL